MAPKNSSRFIDNPPSASPSQDHEHEEEYEEEEEVVESGEESEHQEEEEEEEEEAAEIEEEEEEQEGEEEENPKKKSQGEEGEEGSDGDGSDDDNSKSSPTASDFTIKPSVHANKIQPKSKPNSKRVLELKKDDDVKKDSTRKKAKIVEEETKRVAGNSGGGTVGRIWSEDDEIAVLEGMIDYQSLKGADPQADMGVFHEFVKGRCGFDVTKSQLYEKVRRFKKKYFVNMDKVGASGQDPVFTKPHEMNCFELSKRIWGKSNGTHNAVSNGVDENTKISEGKAKKGGKGKSFELVKSKGDERKNKEGVKKKKDDVEMEDAKEKEEDDEKMIVDKGFSMVEPINKLDDKEDFSEKYPNLTASFDVEIFPRSAGEQKFLKRHMSLISNEKARELEKSWKRLRMEEMEFFCKRSELMIEQTRLVMDAIKKR